jgi:predicted DCC family thiol-disulfide oxidoreductase YuxK
MTKLQPDPQTSSCDTLTVMFDGACPLCRREIGGYQALAPLETVVWLDVSAPQSKMNPDDQARYLARFHVRQKDGHVLSGAAAFVALWLAMPGWRWLGRIGRLPGVTPVLELLYRGFLRLRPRFQRWARAAEAPPSSPDTTRDLQTKTAAKSAHTWST